MYNTFVIKFYIKLLMSILDSTEKPVCFTSKGAGVKGLSPSTSIPTTHEITAITNEVEVLVQGFVEPLNTLDTKPSVVELTLQGGGVKGLATAKLLETILNKCDEQSSGSALSILQTMNFSGVSSGGILALRLAHFVYTIKQAMSKPKFDAQKTLDTFLRQLTDRKTLQRGMVKQLCCGAIFGLLGPELDTEKFEEELQNTFGTVTLGDLRNAGISVTVLSHNLNTHTSTLLSSMDENVSHIRLVEAGRATSAFPTGFEPIELTIGGKTSLHVDGGLSALSLTTQTLKNATTRSHKEKTLTVSLGAGIKVDENPDDVSHFKNAGCLFWIRPLLENMVNLPSNYTDLHMIALAETLDYYDFSLVQFSTKADTLDTGDQNLDQLNDDVTGWINNHQDELDAIANKLVANYQLLAAIEKQQTLQDDGNPFG